MKAYERLLNYVKVPTPSDERSGTHPSSACQRVLAEQLVKEMKKLGVSDVRIDEKCYVYGKIPATKGYESKTKLGFIAHMDTVSDFADHAVNPVVHENYDGKDLKLSESGRTLETAVFPHLASLAGKTLITSDGTTVLGADDKAGVAAIMQAVEEIQKERWQKRFLPENFHMGRFPSPLHRMKRLEKVLTSSMFRDSMQNLLIP